MEEKVGGGRKRKRVESLFHMTIKQTIGSADFVENNLAFCKKICQSLQKNIRNIEFKLNPDYFKNETVHQRFARAEDDDEWVFDHMCTDLNNNKCQSEEHDGCYFDRWMDVKPPFKVFRLRGTKVFLCEEDLGNWHDLRAIHDSIYNE